MFEARLRWKRAWSLGAQYRQRSLVLTRTATTAGRTSVTAIIGTLIIIHAAPMGLQRPSCQIVLGLFLVKYA